MFENNQLTLPLGYILVLALCMSSLILFFVKRWLERDLYGKPSYAFYALFGLMLVVDFAWSILEYKGIQVRFVSFSANLFWYVAFLCICYRWLEVCLWNLSADRVVAVVPRVVRALPVFLTSVFLISSWWTGWAINTTPSGCYLRGPYLWIVYAVVFAYLFATVAVCIAKGFRSQEVTRRRFAYSLIMATGPMILTAYLQYLTGFAFFFIGVIITMAIYDFDAQRKAMEVVLAADKARHDAFTMVSHDIRTPLNAIIGLAELLQHDPVESERKRMCRALVTSSNTLMQLVNDVLDLSKLEAGKLEISPEPTDLSGLVESVLLVCRDSAQSKGLALVSMLPPNVCYVIDSQRIRQILFNLIGNAIKFTDNGEVCVKSDYKNGILSLAVSDTGCGISYHDQKRLMNPYTQVGRHKNRVGTGLGLSICKRLAGLMDGKLRLESALGRGSTFILTLPCEACTDSIVPARTKSDLGNSALHRILMVDDAPMNLTVMSAMLNRLGQTEVAVARDGDEALALLKADPGRFDLVLTDLQMPKMDGDELVREIRADPRLAHLSVHVITADIQVQKDCADAGFTSIIIKPVTISKLRQIL